ncbi:predicted protein [Micromonas commoda]|uniref:Anaphase-promoting complex subunit 7 n=1 Tax=Micromonas commoda (strain RCC299 / NOUM17 / CCMP2709) TaxID=296587 RepID=C1E8Z4_MICCC|nr:predicted protein [Micromonas commoda]ACO64240.1 predicted protein [Micromonas commoda]|eukprot:XP_002502982.1 predicted protein [Micromonas commoda]
MASTQQVRAMERLLAAEMWESAEALGGFLCSASPRIPPDAVASAERARHLALFGDALLGKGEHRRALNAFRQALSVNRLAPKVPTGNNRSSAMGTPETPATPGISPPVDEASLKFKIGRCHLALREYRAALAELETIPARARTLPVTMTLAKTYRRTGYERAAVACYKEVVRDCPYAVDAIAALAELGCSAEEIRADAHHEEPPGDASYGWLHHLAEAHGAARSHRLEAAASHLRRLDEIFPDDPRVWCQLARVHRDRGDVQEAADCYRRCVRSDPCVVDCMDAFAALLNGPSVELNALVNNLLENAPGRAESWSAAALYWESRGDAEKALSFAERASDIDDQHVTAHVTKGYLRLKCKRADAAVHAFKRALQLAPATRTYAGLVASYLILGRIKEATATAKECARAAPNASASHALLGDVEAAAQGHRDRARRFYEHSLKLDPSCAGVAAALAETHAASGRSEAAAELLRRHLDTHAAHDAGAQVALHCRLGAVLAQSKQLADALGHYQSALAIYPESDEARRGVSRVERLMKGQDPDAPDEEVDEEEDDDEEVEDADADGDDGSDFMG